MGKEYTNGFCVNLPTILILFNKDGNVLASSEKFRGNDPALRRDWLMEFG